MSKSLNSLLRNKWRYFAGLALLNTVLGLGFGLLGSEFVQKSSWQWQGGAIALLVILSIRLITTVVADRLSADSFAFLRVEVAKPVLFEPQKSKSQWSTAEVLERLTTDTYNVIDSFVQVGVHGFGYLFLFLVSSAFVITHFPEGLALLFAGGFLYLIVTKWLSLPIQKKTARIRQLETEIFVVEKNLIEGHDYLKTSGRLQSHHAKLESLLQEWSHQEKGRAMRLAGTENFAWAMRLLFVLLLTSALASFLGWQSANLYWVYIAIGSISQLAAAGTRMFQALPLYRRCAELLQSADAAQACVDNISDTLEIRACDLHVDYDPSGKSADGIGPLNFRWQPGDCVWIFGPSGAGKTSLLKYIVGLRKSHPGQLFRSAHCFKISFVEQEPFFFEGESLNYNLGVTEVSGIPSEWIDALGLRKIFENLPAGGATEVGGVGSHFSKGQKTRLALLRALVGRPQILVLDEPTAGLEAALASKILQFLRLQMADGILVIAEHRADIVSAAQPTQVLNLAKTFAQSQRSSDTTPLTVSL